MARKSSKKLRTPRIDEIRKRPSDGRGWATGLKKQLDAGTSETDTAEKPSV